MTKPANQSSSSEHSSPEEERICLRTSDEENYMSDVSVELYERTPEPDQMSESEQPVRPKNLAVGKRPISTVLDKHDQMLLELKAQKFGDTQISRILAEDGGEYDAKTIGTRFRRVRLKMMAANDKPLEDKEMHWTQEEDKYLLNAYNTNIDRHEKQLTQLRARFYEDVGFAINDVKSDTFYSAKACEKRYQDLISGKARPHPDVDQDPDRHRKDFLERLAAKIERSCKQQLKDEIWYETMLHHEGLGKRVSKKPRKKRASGKRASGKRASGKRVKKSAKDDNTLSAEMVNPNDDQSST